MNHPRPLFARRPLAIDETDAQARRLLGEPRVKRLPLERIDELRVAARDQAKLRLRDEVPDDAQKFVAAPSHADVPFAMHSEQASRGAKHEVADFVTVRVVVMLEPVVIDHFDAEPVAAMLLAKRREQPLFPKLPAIQQRAAVAAHAPQERLALLELYAFLAKLSEDVEKDLIPVLDLVADGEVEGLEARADELELRRGELQHAAHVIEQVAHRPGQLRFGRNDLCGQRRSIPKERQLLVHLCSWRNHLEQVQYHPTNDDYDRRDGGTVKFRAIGAYKIPQAGGVNVIARGGVYPLTRTSTRRFRRLVARGGQPARVQCSPRARAVLGRARFRTPRTPIGSRDVQAGKAA